MAGGGYLKKESSGMYTNVKSAKESVSVMLSTASNSSANAFDNAVSASKYTWDKSSGTIEEDGEAIPSQANAFLHLANASGLP